MIRNRLIPYYQYYFISLLTLVVGFFFLTSCGSSSKNAQTSGTVGILLKDAHTVTVEDHAAGTTLTLTQLWVTIDKISLEDSEETWLSVYDSSAIDPATNQPVGPKTYDLLSLHSTADLIALVNLPAGTYHKVRFELETASGSNYFCTGTGIEPCAAPDRYDLTVPSGKVDLELNPNLIIESGSSTNLIFDFVPDKSIHITTTGNSRYLLRPEIHVGLLGTGFPEGGFGGEFQEEEIDLEEFRGTIEYTQCAGPTPMLVLSHHYGQGAVEVDLSQAEIYDVTGSPISCEDLTNDLWVKVKGTLQSDGTILADIVKVKPEFEHGNPDDLRCGEFTGIIDQLQMADGAATFDLLVGGGVQTFHVQVNAQTRIIDERLPDDDLTAGLENLSNGERVDVSGDLHVESSTIVATEIEIKE